MDEIRQRIADAITSLGLSMNEVSRNVGKNAAYLHQYLYRGSPKALPEEVRLRLSRILMIPEAELIPSDVGMLKKAKQAPKPISPAGGPRDVPVYLEQARYTAAMATRDPTQVVARPANGYGYRGIFGVLIQTDKMVGRYGPGDIVIFAPNQPLHPGDGCYIESSEYDARLGIVYIATEDRIALADHPPRTASEQASVAARQSVDRAGLALVAREIAIYRR